MLSSSASSGEPTHIAAASLATASPASPSLNLFSMLMTGGHGTGSESGSGRGPSSSSSSASVTLSSSTASASHPGSSSSGSSGPHLPAAKATAKAKALVKAKAKADPTRHRVRGQQVHRLTYLDETGVLIQLPAYSPGGKYKDMFIKCYGQVCDHYEDIKASVKNFVKNDKNFSWQRFHGLDKLYKLFRTVLNFVSQMLKR